MLKKRIIPVLLLKNGWIVQSKNFSDHQKIGNAFNSVARLSEWGSDELIYLDISRDDNYDLNRDDQNYDNFDNFLNIIEAVAKTSFMPITVGGKIKTLDDIEKRLKLGADKISINTKALDDKNFIKEAAEKFGSQCIVVSADVKKINNNYYVHKKFGKENTGIKIEKWCEIVQENMAGEIMINSIDRDGKKEGYDLDLLKIAKENLDIPLIPLGGVGNWDHFSEAFDKLNINTVAASNIFHYYDQSVYLARKYLYEKKYDVRKPIIL
tara:strand:+ start:190 stop:990 length:801 start_codon:yes stop_codon:yes gene_type:complete